MATLYIDIRGEDREHRDRASRQVSDLVVGGLLAIADTPGHRARWTVNDNYARLGFDAERDDVLRVGEVVATWLQRNLWEHHGTLLRVFIDTKDDTVEILGEASTFGGLVEEANADPATPRWDTVPSA